MLFNVNENRFEKIYDGVWNSQDLTLSFRYSMYCSPGQDCEEFSMLYLSPFWFLDLKKMVGSGLAVLNYPQVCVHQHLIHDVFLPDVQHSRDRIHLYTDQDEAAEDNRMKERMKDDFFLRQNTPGQLRIKGLVQGPSHSNATETPLTSVFCVKQEHLFTTSLLLLSLHSFFLSHFPSVSGFPSVSKSLAIALTHTLSMAQVFSENLQAACQ